MKKEIMGKIWSSKSEFPNADFVCNSDWASINNEIYEILVDEEDTGLRFFRRIGSEETIEWFGNIENMIEHGRNVLSMSLGFNKINPYE